MQVSGCEKTKSYQILYRILLSFIFRASSVVSSLLQTYARSPHHAWTYRRHRTQICSLKLTAPVKTKSQNFIFRSSPNNTAIQQITLKNQTHCVQQVIFFAVNTLYIDQKDCFFQYFCDFSILLYKILNRSDKLFYSLIFYSTTHLYKLLNWLGKLFYFLALSQVICLLCKLLNRSDGIFYPSSLDGLFYAKH